MDWRVLAFLCALMYGIGTFCVAKATPIHGPKIAAFLQVVGYVILLAVMRFGMSDLERVTKTSFAYGAAAAALFVTGSYFIFMGVSVSPERTALIEAIATTGLVFAALAIHFFIGAMTPLQWGGMLLVLSGVVLIHLAS